jgi:predicted Fe-S protein YdhL (DUF1289 family)
MSNVITANSSDTNIGTMTPSMKRALVKVNAAAENDIFVPRILEEQAPAIAKLGINTRMFISLFDAKMIRWVKFEDGKRYAALTRIGKKALDSKPNKTVAPASVQVSEVANSSDAIHRITPAANKALAKIHATLDDVTMIPEAPYEGQALSLKGVGVTVKMFNYFLTAKFVRWMKYDDGQRYAVLTRLGKRVLADNQTSRTKVQTETAASVANSSAPIAVIPARRKTRKLREEIESKLAGLEDAIIAAEKSGKSLSPSEVRRFFLRDMV